MIIILLTVGVSSAFINNTPVVILFISVVMSMPCRGGDHFTPVEFAGAAAFGNPADARPGNSCVF
jgi:Na+/H+ antiporter NhaD/arsenite permease-like protein